MSSNDPQTVMQALPAYLILMDGLLEADPDDEALLKTSAGLMNAYAGLLGSQLALMENQALDKQDQEQLKIIRAQQKKLNQKALARVARAICRYKENFCDLTTIRYSEFKTRLESSSIDDVDMLYSLGAAWVSWLQVNSDDWNTMAQLPQIKLIMQTVVALDENWEHAGAHMYLGVLNSLLPGMLGGKPDTGNLHFEAAIRLTKGKNLMAKVLYAEYYARLVFDEKLHQRLINEVLTSKDSPPDLVLLNTLARQKAKVLEKSAEDYF